MTIDLSTNPEGPYVTRVDGWPMEFVGPVVGGGFIYRAPHGDLLQYSRHGCALGHTLELTFDLIPAPVEPEKRWLVVDRDEKTAGLFAVMDWTSAELRKGSVTLELSVDEHGIPIDGSTIRRVEA